MRESEFPSNDKFTKIAYAIVRDNKDVEEALQHALNKFRNAAAIRLAADKPQEIKNIFMLPDVMNALMVEVKHMLCGD